MINYFLLLASSHSWTPINWYIYPSFYSIFCFRAPFPLNLSQFLIKWWWPCTSMITLTASYFPFWEVYWGTKISHNRLFILCYLNAGMPAFINYSWIWAWVKDILLSSCLFYRLFKRFWKDSLCLGKYVFNNR